MAAREHRVSRRALLGAACALPLGCLPGPDPGSSLLSPASERRWPPDQIRQDEAWRRNLARLRRDEARLRALEGDPDEDRFGDALVVFNHSLKKLLRTPAPALPALLLKIELAVDHEVADLIGGKACLAVLKQDARRLRRSAHPEPVEDRLCANA